MEKKYGNDWPSKDKYTKQEKFLERLSDFVQAVYDVTVNKFVKHRERKIVVRIDKFDTWNMDDTLAHIVLPMLKQIKATKHGASYVDDEDVPAELKSTAAEPKKNDWDTDSNHFKRWDYVLDEMIFAFEAQFNNWEDTFRSGKMDRIFIPIDKDGNVVSKDKAEMYRWEKGPQDTFELDLNGRKIYAERIAKGYALFGKYYQSLWD
jgi:hypothetical protein